jgi:hypothetical protein
MADYTTLGSETRTIQSRIDALQGSTLQAVDILYLSEALQILGTSLGVNDVVGATNAGIAQLGLAQASAIAVVNATDNGSKVVNLQGQYSSLLTVYQNLQPRVTSLESVSSSITSGVATASAQAQAASYNAWKVVNTSTTAVAKDRIFVVPVTGLIITLPAAPNTGDEIAIVDVAGTAGTTNFTVARNGNLIQGSSSDLVFNVNSKSIRLVYSNSTYGWRVL